MTHLSTSQGALYRLSNCLRHFQAVTYVLGSIQKAVSDGAIGLESLDFEINLLGLCRLSAGCR